MKITQQLKSPLFTSWPEQYVQIPIAGLKLGAPVALRMDGALADFQFTGQETAAGAEIMVRLGFAAGETKTLEFEPTGDASSFTDFTPLEIPVGNGAQIGVPDSEVTIPAPTGTTNVQGPFSGFAGYPLRGSIACTHAMVSCELTRTAAGPLYIDYLLTYRFLGDRRYSIGFRCYRHTPLVEVAEDFHLGMESELELTLNPDNGFNKILSHPGFDFEGDGQPKVDDLARDRPKDVLCRLQMPPLGEYAIPNNRGWFALFNSEQEQWGMLGILGLYGAQWVHPIDNMVVVRVRGGSAQWRASLGSGKRFWLLHHGPVEKEFTPERPFIYHNLHGQFNALRLDEHLDLTGDDLYDASCWDAPGFFGEDYRERAKRIAEGLPALRATVEQGQDRLLRTILAPQREDQEWLYERMLGRPRKWVRDFQGYREDKNDYGKNVIGFSRTLRDLMIEYELLRKDGFLTEAQTKELHAYFSFAARRIMDEGRWPHSKTWLHPNHPESMRDLHTYPGEHKPDKLVWSNSLPNFQSDPMCALAHLSCVVPDHPDARHWRRFALEDIERQLDAYCGSTGAWEESINYAFYTLYYFNVTFRILKNRAGIDYFNDERMRRFAAWMVRFVGPFDKRFNCCTYPGVGNAGLPMSEAGVLLSYASELDRNDPLRAALIAAHQRLAPAMTTLGGGMQVLAAAMAEVPDAAYALQPLESEHMDELGVMLRHEHLTSHESSLFQKIGFWKDHYENDETSINWYAKGTPLVMDYGTYTGDVAGAAAHNLVEVPDMDSLQRGYLAKSMFTPLADYTHCEVPVGLKLLHGRLRSFEEIDGPAVPPLFFYIGDDNPLGPKTWKTRFLFFIKPDYVVLFDRIRGPVPHRYNLHVTANEIERDGAHIRAAGRFDLDLHCFVQHPPAFEFETGELIPAPDRYGENNEHRQKFFRLYNKSDDTYRTVLFARERDRLVTIERFGQSGVKIVTTEYTDYVFVGDEVVSETGDDIRFEGRTGWIRREASGNIVACVPDGDSIQAFGIRIEGRGPWHYNMDGKQEISIAGVPRRVTVQAS